MRGKAERRAARERVRAYYEKHLGDLVRRVASDMDGFRAGEIDAFAADASLWQYHRAARELWKFCGSGGHVEYTDGTIQFITERGEDIDWWARGDPEAPRE